MHWILRLLNPSNFAIAVFICFALFENFSFLSYCMRASHIAARRDEIHFWEEKFFEHWRDWCCDMWCVTILSSHEKFPLRKKTLKKLLFGFIACKCGSETEKCLSAKGILDRNSPQNMTFFISILSLVDIPLYFVKFFSLISSFRSINIPIFVSFLSSFHFELNFLSIFSWVLASISLAESAFTLAFPLNHLSFLFLWYLLAAQPPCKSWSPSSPARRSRSECFADILPRARRHDESHYPFRRDEPLSKRAARPFSQYANEIKFKHAHTDRENFGFADEGSAARDSKIVMNGGHSTTWYRDVVELRKKAEEYRVRRAESHSHWIIYHSRHSLPAEPRLGSRDQPRLVQQAEGSLGSGVAPQLALGPVAGFGAEARHERGERCGEQQALVSHEGRRQGLRSSSLRGQQVPPRRRGPWPRAQH